VGADPVPTTAIVVSAGPPMMMYRCEACFATATCELPVRLPPHGPFTHRTWLRAPALWREGWMALRRVHSHFWICPACATTLPETRVVLALRGVTSDSRWVWYLPLRYHAERALWRLRAWWGRR